MCVRSVLIIAVFLTLLCGAIRTAPVEATFPGNNGKIGFDAFDEVNHFEIYSMNPDGTEITNLSNNPAPDADPSWSPDNTKIVFVSNREEGQQIYVMNADGSGQTRLTSGFATTNPSWSPDGTKIVFVQDTLIPGTFAFSTEIYVMNADGTALTRLTFDLLNSMNPDWSPDGTKIAFTKQGFDGGIYIMNPDGSGQTRIHNSFDQVAGFEPSWSPDGTKIAFSGFDFINVAVEIFVMNADGTGLTRLTDTADPDSSPVWSPDGTKIAYTHTDSALGFNDEIFIMNSDGTGQTRITMDTNRKFDLAWQALSATTVSDAINKLIEHAHALGVKTKALTQASKLLGDDNPANDSKACGKLDAFIKYVNSKSGKKITNEQAQELVDEAASIKEKIGC